jgi:hypothetical protein
MKYPFTGVGPFTHNHPGDRPPEIFDGEVTLHTGPDIKPTFFALLLAKK